GGINEVGAFDGQVWVRGADRDGAYLGRFSGSAIEQVELPAGASGVKIVDVNAAGTWVTINGELHRWSGSDWTAVPTASGIWDVSAASASEAYGLAAGNLILRWDGTSWHELPKPELAEQARQITAIAPDDIWLSSQHHLSHWDGVAWTVIDAPDGRDIDEAAVGADSVPMIRAGYDRPSQSTPMYRYRNGTWELVSASVAENGFFHLTVVPGTSQIWAYAYAPFNQRLITNR
ncbi:MAG: hypothetical protein ABIS86_14300, partial [Streptosporangiaceae bacterium]